MKRILMTACALTLCFSLTAMGAKHDEKKTEPWTLKVAGLKGPSGLGMVRLLESPPSLPENAAVSFELLASADLMVAKIMTNEVDIAVLPSNTAVKLFNSGIPYTLGAVTGNGMLSLVTNDPAISSLKDLRGKEVHASGQGAIPEFLARWILSRQGIDSEKDLTLTFNMPYPEMAQSLISGRITYAILPEPFSTMAVRGNPTLRKAVDLQKEYSVFSGEANYPITAVVVKMSTLKAHPETVREFFKAYRSSIEWVVGHPKEAGVLAEQHDIGLKAGVAEAAIPDTNFVFLIASESKPSFSKVLDILLSFKGESIGGKLPDPSFYDFK